ncbi:hypothetical protein [Alcaligenes phenolicus]|uniref:hypothetical protein n=1 Tax=Alcaligenes phenolicus TaxID=232846 RepID=UPI000E996F0B|nr:hypothetical protein [Alcaligenes phenolicus]HBJ68942.1 hypothetical protein [Alcaligenes faecalis]
MSGTKLFESEKALILALVIGIALGVGLGWFTFPFLLPAFKNAALASWVQAIGSIAAIAGAVFAAREGAKATARLKEVRQKRAVLAVVESFLDKVNEIACVVAVHDEHVNLEFYETYSPSSLDGYLHTMDIIPVLELPTPAAMSAMLNLQRQARFFVSAADDLIAGPWSPKLSNYEDLVEARENCEFCKNEYSRGDPEIREAQLKLDSLICKSFENLKWSLSIQVKFVRSEAKVLRQELS